MIVRERPGPLRLLLAWKGSVVPHILPHILLTGLFANRSYLGFAPPLPGWHYRVHASAIHDYGHCPLDFFKRA